MSSFSIVSQNRIAQFAARFEMQTDGSVVYYHPDRATGGLPCTLAEAEQLIEDYAKTCSRSMQWLMYWAIASGIGLGLLDASEIFVTQRSIQYLIILAPFPLMIYSVYQAGLKPLRLLGMRLTCSPPRSSESAFWHRVAALPVGLIIGMLLPSAGLIYYAIDKGWQSLDISSLLIIVSTMLMTVLWLYAQFGRWR
jgi:hypothetical protein